MRIQDRTGARLAVLPLALAALLAAGCSDDVPRRSPAAATSTERAAPAAGVDPEVLRVIRGWTDTLRSGDVEGAAKYFAVPARVANGGEPIRLQTPAEIWFFNETLPCGAELVAARPGPKGYTRATFRLTERPGDGECGSGAGRTAQTDFRVRGGRITDWLRVDDTGPAPTSQV